MFFSFVFRWFPWFLWCLTGFNVFFSAFHDFHGCMFQIEPLFVFWFDPLLVFQIEPLLVFQIEPLFVFQNVPSTKPKRISQKLNTACWKIRCIIPSFSRRTRTPFSSKISPQSPCFITLHVKIVDICPIVSCDVMMFL